ncbi:MAG: hypothetical protein U9R79_10605, partial [Armatimonadota bacterium]|nr:hypothetical protein [Armatimonadota bacterium]
MLRESKLIVAIGLSFLVCSPLLALDINQDPEPEDYLFAEGMGVPSQDRETVFRPQDDRANFTFLHEVKDVQVRDGALAFTLPEQEVTLGWGTYNGQQALTEIQDMCQQIVIVRLRLKQSAGSSRWSLRLWRDGERIGEVVEAELEGRDWQEIEFEPLHADGANPDGLEFTVEGEEGTRIELEWLKLIQPTWEGYCRTEFVLPEGRIWRAMANVGSANDPNWYGRDEMASRLYINGQLVERRGSLYLYHTAPVDIAPYLRAGRNCVGFYGFRIGYQPPLYFQARIIMQSGEVVTVASGSHWTCSPQGAEGWNEPGFDDSGWSQAVRGPQINTTHRDSAHKTFLPAYGGRLLMKSPNRRDLFYTAAQPVVVDVHVPAGLRTNTPTLSYVLGRADARGECTPVTDGVVRSFTQRRGSLVYRVDLGQQEDGVYALALSLEDADGAVIDQRYREPLVVLRRMELQTVDGNSFTEGLDLELEDTIDFTDPDDPHPWFECRTPQPLYGPAAEAVQEPVIVRKGGLVYREVADPKRSSGFSYRFEFEHPGSFYYMEMEYPDDARRIIEVSVSSKTEGVWTNSQAGVGAETGGRFLPTGRMRTLGWIHVADGGPHSVDVINVVDGQKAAAKSLKIYRIHGDLPSVGSGNGRRYGIHTERCFYTSGIGMNFGTGMPRNPQTQREQEKDLPPMQLFIRDLVWLKATGERYVQYLKFAGQNCHVMGCYQYSSRNTPYVPAPPVEDSRVLWCMRSMMANLLDVNGIDFFAGVEFSQS